MTFHGRNADFSVGYEGLVKVRLAHGQGYSLLVVDLVVLPGAITRWFQPYAFTACMLGKTDHDISGMLHIDIRDGHSLRLDIADSTWVKRLRDGSDLFRCSIKGPPALEFLADGVATVSSDHDLQLQLFHHTSAETKRLIEASHVLRASSWNFQGTKKLKNIAYAYLTSVPAIRSKSDLQKIAMASDGYISTCGMALTRLPFHLARYGNSTRTTCCVLRCTGSQRQIGPPLYHSR